jgi:hypothetical protein
MGGRVKQSTGSGMGVAATRTTGDYEEGGPSWSGEGPGVKGAKGQGGGGWKEVVNEERSSAEEAPQSEALQSDELDPPP